MRHHIANYSRAIKLPLSVFFSMGILLTGAPEAQASLIDTCIVPPSSLGHTTIGAGVDCQKPTARATALTMASNAMHLTPGCNNGSLSCSAVCAAMGGGWHWNGAYFGGPWHARNGICLAVTETQSGSRKGPFSCFGSLFKAYHAQATLKGKCGCVCRGPI